MKLTLRLVLVPVSLAVGFLLAIWGERFTVAPLGHGRYEGTPATVLEFFTVFPLVSIVLLIAGNLAISCYFSSTKSCSTAYRLYEHMTRTILTCWIAGAAFAGLLIVLDIECVHSACQDIVMFLSLLPLIAASSTAYLITGPHHHEWLIDCLMVLYGGLFYGAVMLLIALVWRRSKAK